MYAIISCIMLFCYTSAAYAATKALCICLLHIGFTSHPMPSVLLSLHKNTEWILMKFARGNHYHQQIKWLYIWQIWNRDKGAGCRKKHLNQRHRRCCNVKQVLTPSEWIHKFQSTWFVCHRNAGMKSFYNGCQTNAAAEAYYHHSWSLVLLVFHNTRASQVQPLVTAQMCFIN